MKAKKLIASMFAVMFAFSLLGCDKDMDDKDMDGDHSGEEMMEDGEMGEGETMEDGEKMDDDKAEG